jgi:endonuclease/exonuclease/phosphatase family metal-dependent hydrolase
MLKHTFITVISTFIIYGGCWAQTFEDLEFGTEETLDVITWNIEWFPKNGGTTTGYVKEIIEGLAADVYAIQEIDDTTAFKTMVNLMEDYE